MFGKLVLHVMLWWNDNVGNPEFDLSATLFQHNNIIWIFLFTKFSKNKIYSFETLLLRPYPANTRCWPSVGLINQHLVNVLCLLCIMVRNFRYVNAYHSPDVSSSLSYSFTHQEVQIWWTQFDVSWHYIRNELGSTIPQRHPLRAHL